MMRMILPVVFTILTLLVPSAAPGEEARSERELMRERYLEFPSLVRGGHLEPHWLDDGKSFWFADGAPDRVVIHQVDTEANTKTPLFDADRLRRALVPLLGHEPAYRGLPFEEFSFTDDRQSVEFAVEDQRYRLWLDDYALRRLPDLTPAEESRFHERAIRPSTFPGYPPVREMLSPDRRWFLSEKDHNLQLRSTADGRLQPLTDDGTAEQPWKVWQDDMWLSSRWSPDGLRVVTLEEDLRGVPRSPVVHWLKTTAEVQWVPLAKAGQTLARAELTVIDVYTRRQVKIAGGGEPDQFLATAGWLPDGSELYFLRASRDFKSLRLIAADPKTGATRQLVEERQETFVKNLSRNPTWLELFTLLPESRRFLWISERDGWDHLYLYDLDGELIRRLTRGEFPLVAVVAVDEPGGWVYFTAHADRRRVYDTHLYRVSLDGGQMRQLTDAPGQHEITFSPSLKVFLDRHSSLDRPPRVDLRRADGHFLQTLLTADVEGLKPLRRRLPESFVVKAADGETDLHGVLFKPWDFDPAKKYPVIEHIYGGPQTVHAPRTFGGGGTAYWRGTRAQSLAQLGFITLMVDARGTPERGKAFQDVVYGNFGRHEIPDHAAVLRQLAAERPYMDLDRVGIFGSSWGAYMTVRALLLAPEVYHVGIATNPLYDLFDHGAVALEGYLGLLQDNFAAYEYGSSLRLVENLKGKLLLIHATSDINATLSTTMKMTAALARAGKPYDLILLPDQNHHIKGQSQRYRLDAHQRYFQEHLKP